jgi:hypothetical protein
LKNERLGKKGENWEARRLEGRKAIRVEGWEAEMRCRGSGIRDRGSGIGDRGSGIRRLGGGKAGRLR